MYVSTLMRRRWALFFHFLRSLPEKKIRADGRAEHCDQREEIVRAQREIRNERVQAGLEPRHAHHERRRDVGEEGERQPLQERRVPGKGNEDLQSQRHERERQDIQTRRASDQQLQGCGHRAEIRRDVDRVGDQQERDDCVEQRPRIMLPDVGGKALPRDTSDARAHDLDADHERQREQHRPQHAVPELRARLRIGGNAARIVRGAGDQSRPQLLQQG